MCGWMGGRKGAIHYQLFALTVCQAMGVARAPEHVRDSPSARSPGVELKRVTKLSRGYSVLTVASGQAWTRCLVELSYPFLSVSLSDKCCLSLPFCSRG